ncbi:MAG: hypothetical protein JKY67_15395 [Pseudomonadales bacterium]|nr:hypothetical protein [Pseudomonadales bacterium]
MAESTQPFILENGRPIVLGTTCGHCQYSWFPAVEFGCEQCGTYGEGLSSKRFSMQGRSLSFADIKPGSDKSFTLCTIELDNGPTIRAILGHDVALNIGDSVAGRVETIDEKSVVRFYGEGK